LDSFTTEEGLRATLASIGDGVIAADAEGRVVFLNPVAQALTGWTQEEARGRPLGRVFRIVNEHTRQEAEDPAARALREGAAVGLANPTLLIARDGTERPIDDSASPVRNARGQVGGVVLVFRDITDRRRAERLAQDARLYAENIVETVREPLLMLDAGLRVRTANRSFYRAFGVTPGETEGRLVYELGNGQWDIPRLRTLLEEVLPGNTSFEDFEMDHDFPGLGRRVMVLNARRIYREGNHTELILLAVEDVTAHRREEAARREVETRYTSLVRNIKDHSVFMMDAAGHISSWNVEAERIIGYSEGEVLGRHFSVIFTPEDVERGVPGQELRLAREEGRAEDERWHLRKDGRRFWALGIVTPMLDAGGGLAGYSKILRDMTDRKRAEELLHRQSEALKEADRRKDEFLAMLSHELRNPLAPIRNAAQVISLTGPADPNARRAAEMIERQVGQMTRLVEDLLDVSRITSGKIRLQVEPVELAAVVARAVETVRPLIERRGQELTIALCPEPVWVEGDLTRLTQVVANLLNNAAKYTDEGGHIGLTVGRQGGRGEVRVRDDGVGIPADVLPRVFDLFKQGDRSLARSEGGLGVGLSVVRSLVEMHGGRAEAFSDGPGRGSEFVVQFPAVDTKPAPRAGDGEAGASHPPVRPRTVLVVDDNVDAAESLAMLLRVDGHEVRTAYDGPTALETARAFRPEVAFIDIGLPGIDGCEVARRLRGPAGAGGALLVALTGYGQEEDRRKSLEAGFDAHLVKPADPAALAKLLALPRAHTGGRGARP
jgi:PAS domain S-box-containing protein